MFVSANNILFLTHLLCALLCFAGTAAQFTGVDSGYNYYPEIHGYLKLHNKPADWLGARVNCYMEEALLAAPWSNEFLRTINLVIKANQISLAVYSGAQITFPEGIYKYVKGEPVQTLEPSHLKSVEQCVVFLNEGTIGVVNCDVQLPYVCYLPAPGCGEQSHRYNYSNRTGQCYKFHTVGSEWFGAHNTCQEEGAHLAVINSDVEAQVLVELLEEYPADILRSYVKNYTAIGVYYKKSQGAWYTIHDQTLEQAGYSRWHEGAPYTYNNYGYLLRDGTLIDNSTYGTPFICEKKPVMLDIFKHSSTFSQIN